MQQCEDKRDLNPSDSRILRSLDCSGNCVSSLRSKPQAVTDAPPALGADAPFLREKREPHGLSFFAEKEGFEG